MRLDARLSMSIPPPGWPKAVTSAKGSDIGDVGLAPARLRSLASAPERQGAPIGPKAAMGKQVGLWSGEWWHGLLRALGPCCVTAHHVLHQVGHVGLRTTSLGGAGLLSHRAHAHASRPQLRITERHQAAAQEQSHGRVFSLSSTGSEEEEAATPAGGGSFANTSFGERRDSPKVRSMPRLHEAATTGARGRGGPQLPTAARPRRAPWGKRALSCGWHPHQCWDSTTRHHLNLSPELYLDSNDVSTLLIRF